MLKRQLKVLIATFIVFATQHVHAALISYNSNGVDLVYSMVSDVTWTKDANLLSTMFDTQGFSTVVNAILDVSPYIINTPNFLNLTGTYTLKESDFSVNGQTTWFGAMAYVNYLNSINYAGANNWYLPAVANPSFGINTVNNGISKGDELTELYYQELGSKAYPASDMGIVDTNNNFMNEQLWAYWTNTEHKQNPSYSWVFSTGSGFQFYGDKNLKYYAWAVSPGQVATVPEPESTAMLFVGLGLIAFIARRRN